MCIWHPRREFKRLDKRDAKNKLKKRSKLPEEHACCWQIALSASPQFLISGLDRLFLLWENHQHSENSIKGTLKATYDEGKIALLKIEELIAQTSFHPRYQYWRSFIKERCFLDICSYYHYRTWTEPRIEKPTHTLPFDVPGLFYAKDCKCIKHL